MQLLYGLIFTLFCFSWWTCVQMMDRDYMMQCSMDLLCLVSYLWLEPLYMQAIY